MVREGSGEDLRRMADALRSGAKMLSEACPACSSPLFDLKGEIWCLRCQKRVVRVRDEGELPEAMLPYVIRNLSTTIISKLEELTLLLTRTSEPENIKRIADSMQSLINLLLSGRSLRKSS